MDREITLMVYINEDKDPLIQEIKDFCKEQGITITKTDFRYFNKYDKIFDFDILGRTREYQMLVLKFGDKIIERYYASFGNVFDLDKESFDKYQKVLLDYYNLASKDNKLHNEFVNLLNHADTLEKAQHLKRYPMDDFSKLLLEDKIAKFMGEKCSWEKWLVQEVERGRIISTLIAAQKGEYSLTNNDIEGIKQFLMKDYPNNTLIK